MICPYFYFQYDKLICRCVQEESNCLAITEKCEFKLGRQTYESDLKDEELKGENYVS